tara:strand:+ start:150 stop:761 length:612 start_codon:yes stop_codon:yes gene_type:complete
MSDLKKMDESRANKIIEQVQEEQAQKEINDIKEKGKSIGLSMEGFSDLDVPVDQAPLLQPINGKYRIDQQHFALMFLEVFQRESPVSGELVPMYAHISRMLDIPKSTLKQWWKRKEEIQSQQSTMMTKGMDYIGTNFMVEMIRMTQAMSTIDYSEMLNGKPADVKNFITLLNTLVNKIRLLTNQSTNNVAHEHRVQMVIPDSD